ncbi:hypothetical protein ONS95_012835 [Cadophora gregata]|uniref:uncharacterized protein n=1 Tax=Cadophora gregata TaxID=51156 RepID=UPI0026DB0283|nr:uncharacterized protein ONS95_012835 [Cadophora gregata]KAK0101184.1 hypothetical protein ONS96_006406 [Cadophora gregata f. sp. sojae]KAK0115783.1 hypothetical protein ONS95_012835 [Cadophora gregata]
MFDLPDAKRVRRVDLNRSRSTSPSISSETDPTQRNADIDAEDARTALLQAKLAALLGPVEFDTPVRSGLGSGAGKDGNGGVDAGTSGDTERADNRQRKEHADKGNKRRKTAEEEKGGDSNGDIAMDSDSGSDTSSNDNNPQPLPSTPPQDQDQEYDFILFQPPSNQSQSSHSHKIILSTSDEPTGTGRILRPRPREFYIVPKATGEKKTQFNSAAVTGLDILADKGKRHWGLEVGWRVRVLRRDGVLLPPSSLSLNKPHTTLKSTISKPFNLPDPTIPENPHTKRTKPNKKRRIILREKKRKRELAEEARRKEREGKEEAEREKRTRRNREKKVKKRLKEKARKAGGGGGDGGELGEADLDVEV